MQFERDIENLEKTIRDLKENTSFDRNSSKITSLEKKKSKLLSKIYSKLTPWQKVQVARHPDRPKFCDYINTICTDFVEIRGDRLFGQDNAILTGFATIEGIKIAIIGHEKGRTVEERIEHNFGMPLPEGYRKAQRLLLIANKFKLPVVTLIDTSGAFPGIESEERGQAEAIARCIETSFNIDVPIIAVIIGEGGSGGAIAIGAADYVLMLENSIYSVISPEGCASILWKDAKYAENAASAQKLTAHDLYKLRIIDHIIPEKYGGAHRNPLDTINAVKDAIVKYINISENVKTNIRKINRRKRFMDIGNCFVTQK